MYLRNQLKKVQAHYKALKEFYTEIEKLEFDYTLSSYENLNVSQKALLEAYLKRFASLQDYLGAKVFKTLLDKAGISYVKMSEVLALIEKEGIINLDRWIEFRNLRNQLEHEYPDEIEDALKDLRHCVESFYELEDVVKKVFLFARQFDETIKLP